MQEFTCTCTNLLKKPLFNLPFKPISPWHQFQKAHNPGLSTPDPSLFHKSTTTQKALRFRFLHRKLSAYRLFCAT